MTRSCLALCLLLLTATAAVAQDREEELHRYFFESQGYHFTVLFEGPQDHALATRALEVLEEAYFRIGTALATFPDETITVVLYTQQQFRDVTRAPAWAAAAYDGRIRVPIRGALERPEELTRVLSHELTHAIVRTIAPRNVPTWLSEGLAALFEPDGAARADAELAGTTGRLPFARLARSFQSLSGQDARLAYAQSTRIARELLDEGGGHTIVAILRDLAAGRSFRAAYEQRLFLPYDAFVARVAPGQ